jgi:hypothetical protein
MRSGLLLFSVLSLVVLDTHTAGANTPDIPEVLKPWQSWVLEDQKEHGCPFLYQDFTQKRCAWPQKLVLDLRTGNGTFSQAWTVYRESWISLPGDLQDWPQDVSLDGRPAAVETRNGLPMLHVLTGQHRIQGRFDWAKMPQSLSLAADTGLIQLLLNGIEIRPEISDEGRLWLKSADLASSSSPGSVDITVFRRVTDDYPLQVQTHMEIDVSGQTRELLLPGALLPGAAPVNLESPIPA